MKSIFYTQFIMHTCLINNHSEINSLADSIAGSISAHDKGNRLRTILRTGRKEGVWVGWWW
jgi:hypothetical protein